MAEETKEAKETKEAEDSEDVEDLREASSAQGITGQSRFWNRGFESLPLRHFGKPLKIRGLSFLRGSKRGSTLANTLAKFCPNLHESEG
jgi:hypothetical protein